MSDLPPQTVAAFARLGAVGLEIARCPRCAACTRLSWAELAAAPGDRLGAVVARMRCRGCGVGWPEASVHGDFGRFEEA